MKNVNLMQSRPVLMHLKGKHNLGTDEPKRWSRAMIKDEMSEMLARFDRDYKCRVKVFERNEGQLLILVMHEAGSVDKIVATPIR